MLRILGDMEEQQHGTELPGLNIMNIQLDLGMVGGSEPQKKHHGNVIREER